jgi:hypothetical protein
MWGKFTKAKRPSSYIKFNAFAKKVVLKGSTMEQ